MKITLSYIRKFGKHYCFQSDFSLTEMFIINKNLGNGTSHIIKANCKDYKQVFLKHHSR